VSPGIEPASFGFVAVFVDGADVGPDMVDLRWGCLLAVGLYVIVVLVFPLSADELVIGFRVTKGRPCQSFLRPLCRG
jgi:hypothetical protein